MLIKCVSLCNSLALCCGTWSKHVSIHHQQRFWMRRYARVFVFCYTLALHLLIMGVLARWSHGHSQTLAATELLQAQQVCTCSAFATVCGAKKCDMPHGCACCYCGVREVSPN